MEVFKALPEGTLAELIDNQLFMSPSPAHIHQKMVKKIARKLDQVVEDNGLREVIIAPFDVFLDEAENAVQPDIVVILKNNPGTFTETGHFKGVPDLLIEILSQANRNHDLVRKKALYERFGVREYWVVDPESQFCIVFELLDGKYKKSSEAVGLIPSPLLQNQLQF
jgi:Uma2 family endonuclease